ncbi:MAG: ATP-binding protein, partial [Butyricicoccus sp.]
DEPSIYADGRLLWRIFDNLLGNIVKYALSGTRVYIDLESTGNRVTISLKNISREQLSISSEELMERFVRGDASRSTEGSGLGLSIARSLTELMQGHFDLIVDGDLFKIVLDFEKMAD